MNDWQHGYVTDVPYTYGFYKECASNWLDWVALLKGSEPPTEARRTGLKNITFAGWER